MGTTEAEALGLLYSVGHIVDVGFRDIDAQGRGFWHSVQVPVIMAIRGPRGSCRVFGDQSWPQPLSHRTMWDADSQAEGIRAFMEWQRSEASA